MLLGVGFVAGRIVARLGIRAVAVGGLAVIAAGLFLIGGVGLRTGSTPYVLAGLVILSAGIGTLMSAAVPGAVSGVPEEQSALAGAVVNTAILAGPTISLALITSAADARTASCWPPGTRRPRRAGTRSPSRRPAPCSCWPSAWRCTGWRPPAKAARGAGETGSVRPTGWVGPARGPPTGRRSTLHSGLTKGAGRGGGTEAAAITQGEVVTRVQHS